MKNVYFTPGPSQLYPTVGKHMQNAIRTGICSLSHRSHEFKMIYQEASDNIRALLGVPATHDVAFLSSALEIMAKTIENIVQAKSFHLVDGAFSQKWMDFARELGKKTGHHTMLPPYSLSDVRIPDDAELVCITQNETSTGIMIPMEEIYGLKRKYPRKVFALDIVSSAPYPVIDFSYVDLALLSVQKGLGLPAGLSILIVRRSLVDTMDLPYPSFRQVAIKARKNQTLETPNVLNIYLTAKTVSDLRAYGVARIRKETEEKAAVLYRFFESCRWGKPFIDDRVFRSPTTLAIAVDIPSENIVSRLKKKGLVVGRGYGEHKDKHIRIANFPQHTPDMMRRLVAEMRKI